METGFLLCENYTKTAIKKDGNDESTILEMFIVTVPWWLLVSLGDNKKKLCHSITFIKDHWSISSSSQSSTKW